MINQIYYQADNPYILTTSLKLDDVKRNRMIAAVLDQRETGNYHGGYTFEIRDTVPYYDFAWLYNIFYSLAEELFSPFTLSTRQQHRCWANVYNTAGYCNAEYVSNMHHHLRTSSINGIFYLNVPTLDSSTTEGGLKILHEEKEFIFLPDSLDLVIMPSWMPHEPLIHSSSEYRIAINMEIATTEPSQDVFNLSKVYERCQINLN